MTLVLAHRGFHLQYPENTLSAFRAAKAVGAHGLELDVHISQDGQLPIFHDRKLSCGSETLVIQRASLAQLQAQSQTHYGEAMPTLESVLDEFLPVFSCINVELKGQGRARDNLRLVERVLSCLTSYSTENILISSFHPFILRAVKDRAPHIKTGFLMQPLTVTAAMWEFWLGYTQANFFHPRYDWYFKYKDKLARHRHRVALWTLDPSTQDVLSPLTLERLAEDERIAYVIGNRPDLWLS